MRVSPHSLSYELHKLTARLDRMADALLRDETGVSYSRFLALFAVTQQRVRHAIQPRGELVQLVAE